MKEIPTQLRKGGAIPHCAAAEPQNTIVARPLRIRARTYSLALRLVIGLRRSGSGGRVLY
jgi:hypothetical protein